jgi:hypothetical protein
LGKSGRQLRVVAVSWKTGQKIVATEKDPNIEGWIYASASEPVFFDPAEIDGELYTDGGLRDIAPVGEVELLLLDGLIGEPAMESRTLVPELAGQLGPGRIDVDLRTFHPAGLVIVAAANLDAAVACHPPLDLDAEPQDEIAILLCVTSMM